MAEAAGVTLEQIAAKCELDPRRLEEKCNEEKILFLSEQILDPILVMGTALKLNERQIRNIDADRKTEKEKRIALLQEWVQTFAFKATYKTFVEALLSCKRANNAMEVCKMLSREDDKAKSQMFSLTSRQKFKRKTPPQVASVTSDSKYPKLSNYTPATDLACSTVTAAAYTMQQNPKKRTILIMGKAGGGKSTLANTVLGVNKFEVAQSFTSRSMDIEEGEQVLQDNYSSQYYTVRIINVNGRLVFDTDHRRSLSQLFFRVLQKIHSKVPEGLHLILFVIKRERWTQDEQDSFDFILKHCDTWSKFSALVITGCENLDEQGRRTVIENFRSDSKRAAVARFMQKGIYTVGFPNVREASSSLRAVYEKNSAKDREKIRQLIYECDDCLSQDQISQILYDLNRCSLL